jgi:pimeloyl-ACP methyl ester carboxylesterase
MCHGFPGTRLEGRHLHVSAARAGIRLIAPDRPGIGCSDYIELDSVADWPEDAAGFADMLGLERFEVLGISGGGPYALACGALLPDRVDAVHVVASPSPIGESELSEMRVGDRTLVRLARRAPGLFSEFVKTFLALGRLRPARLVSWVMRGLSPVDIEVASRPKVARSLAANAEEALRRGSEGMLGEAFRYARPWGFDLADIGCRVHVWHGDLDRLIPPTMAGAIATGVSDAVLHIAPLEGHVSLLHAYAEEILEPNGFGLRIRRIGRTPGGSPKDTKS